jgi:hypothetical protein
MMLITKSIRKKLLENGRNRDQNHPPVVKFFGGGACTWLISEMDPDDPDRLFGLCDMGHGFPELGNVLLSDIEGARFKPFHLPAERDRDFDAKGKRMSEYVDEASEKGYIRT